MDKIEALPDLGKKPSLTPYIYDSIDQALGAFAGLKLPNDPNAQVFGAYCSCGVSILSGLSYDTPEAIVNKIIKQRSDGDYKKIKEAFVVFSDRHRDYERDQGGNALYKYIKDNNLGDIMEFGPRMNPNTGNMIKLWVWAPPHESLRPKDKLMPVYGKIIKTGSDGIQFYEPAPRFQSSLKAATEA